MSEETNTISESTASTTVVSTDSDISLDSVDMSSSVYSTDMAPAPVSVTDTSDSILPHPMTVRNVSLLSARDSYPSIDMLACPCCLQLPEDPRILSCLHSVCTPCLNKVRKT